ncbi:MAG: hypothetical protein IPJ94_07540 [Chloroflexi bacterium]|nr:hypothetical protein [Chloroflexota bacterium]
MSALHAQLLDTLSQKTTDAAALISPSRYISSLLSRPAQGKPAAECTGAAVISGLDCRAEYAGEERGNSVEIGDLGPPGHQSPLEEIFHD